MLAIYLQLNNLIVTKILSIDVNKKVVVSDGIIDINLEKDCSQNETFN